MDKKFKVVSTSKAKPSDAYSARRVSLAKVKKFLRLAGFNHIQLQQDWRHVHGSVMLDGQVHFFKMASTSGISRATRNETRWNNLLSSRFSQQSHSAFFVPRVYSTGRFDGCFYYVSQFVDGIPLWERSRKGRKQILKSWIPRIAECHVDLLGLRNLSFTWDSPYKRVKHPGRKFFKRALYFYMALNDESLGPVLDMAQEIEALYRPGVAHGDSTPWHMIAANGSSQFALVDAEWACSMLPRYYDIAYFYHRLYTMAGQRELARQFLKTTYSLLSTHQKRDFERRFIPVLAERVLGGFWDVSKGGNHATGGAILPYRRLKRDLLAQDLW